MKRMILAAIALAAIALPATASAFGGGSMSYLQSLLMQNNKRFALEGQPFRIAYVKCINESPISAFCVEHFTDGTKYSADGSYNERTGIIHWRFAPLG